MYFKSCLTNAWIVRMCLRTLSPVYITNKRTAWEVSWKPFFLFLFSHYQEQHSIKRHTIQPIKYNIHKCKHDHHETWFISAMYVQGCKHSFSCPQTANSNNNICFFFLLKLRIKKFKIKLANQTLLVYVSSKWTHNVRDPHVHLRQKNKHNTR